MYYDKTGTKEWQMLPWDLEESLGISSGLGGKPAPDYCILECEQWNSPLYCNWNHTQVGMPAASNTPAMQVTVLHFLFCVGATVCVLCNHTCLYLSCCSTFLVLPG